MRYIALATLALLTVGTFDARTASAAPRKCVGTEVACKSAGSASKASYKKASYKKASYKKASYKKQHAVAHKKGSHAARRAAAHQKRVAKKTSGSSYSAVSHSGGGSGIASYYWQGQQTASGARFNPNGLTAAHRTLPFGTRVHVTNHSNGRSVTVTINDRGPFIKGRVIDLSRGAASAIGMTGQGLARVSYTVVGRG